MCIYCESRRRLFPLFPEIQYKFFLPWKWVKKVKGKFSHFFCDLLAKGEIGYVLKEGHSLFFLSLPPFFSLLPEPLLMCFLTFSYVETGGWEALIDAGLHWWII